MQLMSRELISSIPAAPGDPKPTEVQLMYNEGTIVLFQFALSELWFVVGAQSFPLRVRRRCDYLLESANQIKKILNFRPHISARSFEQDQELLGKLILDFQKEVAVEYKKLYSFLLQVEEQNAYEGFRALFDLQDVDAEDTKETDEERKIQGFIRRRYGWVGGAEESWLHEATTFYSTWEFEKTPFKTKILRRFGKD